MVLSAVDYAPGEAIRARIEAVANRSFTDPLSGQLHSFTWRTISTWLYRFKKTV
jgi:putative transposase